MARAGLLVLALVAACHHRGGDQVARARAGDAEGAAAELRYQLASHPRDPSLLIALAEVEELRGRPGAALDALDRAALLGRPFRAGVGGEARARLAALLLGRGTARADRGSPDAEADLNRARRLGAQVDTTLAQRAALAAIAGDLKHSDPDRRARGRTRLLVVDPSLAVGLAEDAPVDALDRTSGWLVAHGAKRVAYQTLDRVAERTLAAGRRVEWRGELLERWLVMRRWWAGSGEPIDRPTLDDARARGASSCAYASGAADLGCDVVIAARDTPSWEPALVDAWERAGWRAADPARAQAWAVVAARATARGQLASVERAVRDHVEPALYDEAIASAVASAPPPTTDPRAWPELAAAAALPELAAAAAAPPGQAPPITAATAASASALAPQLAALVRAYAVDPALADRGAEDVAAAALDLATVAPALARLFRLLDDPARARSWWQRAHDASPEDPALALGLAIAMADAGDPPAGLQLAIRAAAGSGDAAATLVAAARGFAATGETLDALTLARQAIEVSGPGDEAPAAGLAAALLRRLGRTRAADEVAALAALPGAWDLADLTDEVVRVTALAATQRGVATARALALARSSDPAAAAAGAGLLRAIARETRPSDRGSGLP